MPAVHTTPLPPLPETAIRITEQAKWHLDVAIRTARTSPTFAATQLRQARALISDAMEHLGCQPKGGAL